MRQTLLRRGLITALGFAALLFATLGTQPATTASAADIFSNVGCNYGDYSCLYTRSGYNVYGMYGFPTVYQPSYTNYPPYWGYYNYSYAPAYNYSYAYTPVNYSYYSYPLYNYSAPFYGYNNGYYYNSYYGYVPSRFFTRVGCPVGNFSCVRGK